MNISHITTLPQIKEFLKKDTPDILKPPEKPIVYAWLDHILAQLKYRRLDKKDKGTVKKFVKRVTDYSEVQINRLFSKHKQGKLRWNEWKKTNAVRFYLAEDIKLLHKVDSAHQLSGPATKKIFQREYEVFGRKEYRKLANISTAHIYNLRKSLDYTINRNP